MQPNTRILCIPKCHTCKHDIHDPSYKGSKKEFRSTNNMEHKFWFCHDNINTNNFILDWPMVPNTWPMKIGTNLLREEVFGAWRCQAPIAIEGGIFAASLAFGNCDTPNLLVAVMCIAKSKCPPNSHTLQDNVSHPTSPTTNHKNNWRAPYSCMNIMLLESLPFHIHGLLLSSTSSPRRTTLTGL